MANSPLSIFPQASVDTSPIGINQGGVVVGNWFADTGHGFIEINGNFQTADDPQGAQTTVPTGLNASGEMVGSYVNASGQPHGFIANCQLPH
jgi:hypothetical protein